MSRNTFPLPLVTVTRVMGIPPSSTSASQYIDLLLAVQHSLFSRSGCRCSLLRASTEHILIVRGLRAVGSICLAPSSSVWGGISHCWLDRNKKATVSGGLFVIPPPISARSGAG
jgi:hypothetical protein